MTVYRGKRDESEIEKTKSQILNKADQNVKELKIELEKEKNDCDVMMTFVLTFPGGLLRLTP